MEPTTFNIGAYVLIPILAAVLGGWVGAFFGNKYQKAKEDEKMTKVRGIAIKALKILESYAKKSYREAESEFNNSLSIPEKRTIIVALNKLGIPMGVPVNEVFNIRKIHFLDTVIDKDEIKNIIFQVSNGYCDNLFYIDPDSYFAANYTLFAYRNAAKKYIKEVLAKSTLDINKNIMTSPYNWENLFSLGELKPVYVFKDQVNVPLHFDENGKPRADKIESLLNDIDMGLFDSYLTWNYEAYVSVKEQIRMGQATTNVLSNMPIMVNTQINETKNK